MKNLIRQIRNKKILVLGDFMLDSYLHGKANRISPEAPVPVVAAERTDLIPGGAANVISNLCDLGCRVTGAGFVGEDAEGDFLINKLKSMGVNVECVCRSSLVTVHKTRVLANDQHIVRFDYDSYFDIEEERNQFLGLVTALICTRNYDAVIVSDYSKGTIFDQLMSILMTHVHCPVICDLKPQNKSMFYDVHTIAPNFQEAIDLLGNSAINMKPLEMARNLQQDMRVNTVIITMADHGILCVNGDGKDFSYPAHVDLIGHDPKHRLDVTGAGDTVISVYAAGIAAGLKTHEAVLAANVAAGVVVRKVGTTTCSITELVSELDKEHYNDRIATEIQQGS